MVIASIHQPSHATLSEFNTLVLLSQGYLCYRGQTTDLEPFLTQMGIECAPFVSFHLVFPTHGSGRLICRSLKVPPTDTAMQLLNTDFNSSGAEESVRMSTILRFRSHLQSWESLLGEHRAEARAEKPGAEAVTADAKQSGDELTGGRFGSIWYHTYILGERMALNYSR
jgi:hypothetical protein